MKDIGKKIVNDTRHNMQKPMKFEQDKIKENTTINGDVLCIECELAPFVKETRTIRAGIGFNTPRKIKLNTYFCDICDFIYIQDEEVLKINKLLKKHLKSK